MGALGVQTATPPRLWRSWGLGWRDGVLPLAQSSLGPEILLHVFPQEGASSQELNLSHPRSSLDDS